MWKVLTFNKSAVKDAFLTQGVEPAATGTLVATARPPLPGLEYTLKGQEQTIHFKKRFFLFLHMRGNDGGLCVILN
jgi:hypothetical protein